MLERVPGMFLLLGGVYAGLGILASFGQTLPTASDSPVSARESPQPGLRRSGRAFSNRFPHHDLAVQEFKWSSQKSFPHAIMKQTAIRATYTTVFHT